MLSSFLPPVPSLPSDPPEHFPLRKTGELDRQTGTLPIRVRGRALSLGQECRARRAGSAGLGRDSVLWGSLSGSAFSCLALRDDWKGRDLRAEERRVAGMGLE